MVEWLEVVEGKGSRAESGGEWSTWRAAEPEEARSRDAAAPVEQRTRASGREVPERVRRPRTESGPGGTTLTVVGEDSPANEREVVTPFLSFIGVLCN